MCADLIHILCQSMPSNRIDTALIYFLWLSESLFCWAEPPFFISNSGCFFFPDIYRKPSLLQSPGKHPPCRADDALQCLFGQSSSWCDPERKAPVQGGIWEKYWLGVGSQQRVLQLFHQPHRQLHGPGQVGSLCPVSAACTSNAGYLSCTLCTALL